MCFTILAQLGDPIPSQQRTPAPQPSTTRPPRGGVGFAEGKVHRGALQVQGRLRRGVEATSGARRGAPMSDGRSAAVLDVGRRALCTTVANSAKTVIVLDGSKFTYNK